MIKSKMNQVGNARNPYQGLTKKVLCVCSAGLLRSPTIANVLHEDYSYNTRACGVSEEYALIPISTALITWADEIVFAEREHFIMVEDFVWDKPYQILDLPDCYSFEDKELKGLIRDAYSPSN